MFQRIVVVVAFGGALAGCASENPSVSALGSTSALAVTAAPPEQAGPQPGQMPRKTMSDRVLAAIAFERVTGLKTDPARLAH